jgi:hypothetical protein
MIKYTKFNRSNPSPSTPSPSTPSPSTPSPSPTADQTLEIQIEKDTEWTVRDLTLLIDDINSIYNILHILDLVKDGRLHAKIVQNAIDIADLLDKAHIKDNLDEGTLSSTVLPSKNSSMTRFFMKGAFETIEQYLSYQEKLRILSIHMASPGGIKFWSPLEPPPDESNPNKVEFSTPLIQTKNILQDMSEKKSVNDILNKLVIQYRMNDPVFLALVKEYLISGVLGDIQTMIASDKIVIPKAPR